MKRALCIILSLALIVTLIAVPALAVDEIVDPGPFEYNLFDSFSYYNYYGDTFDLESTSRNFTAFAYGNEYIFRFDVEPSLPGRWNPDEDLIYSSKGEPFYAGFMYFYFYCDADILSVNFNYYDYDDDFSSFEIDFISKESFTHDEFEGFLYCYAIDLYDVIYQNFSFSFYLESSVSFLNYESFALYNNTLSKMMKPNVEIEAYGSVFNSSDSSYYRQSFYRNLYYPYGDDINVNGDPRSLPFDDRMNFYVYFKDGYQAADKFSLTLLTTGIFDNYYDYGSAAEAGLNFDSYSDGLNYNIPINTYFTKVHSSSWYGLDVYLVTFTADLSYYDLTSGSLELNFVVNGRQPFEDQHFTDYFVRIDNCYFYYGENTVNSQLDLFMNRFTHWFTFNIWQPMQYYFDWFRTGFDTLEDKFYMISADMHNEFEWMHTWMDQLFDSLFDKLDQLLGVPDGTAPPSADDQQQQIEDSIDDMDGVSDDFSSAGDQIDELLPNTPSYEDTGLAGAADIAGARILELRAVFVVLWDNDFIIQLLTFSCLLALGGFILFGER